MTDFEFDAIDDLGRTTRPAWQDTPITIPLEEYVRLRVLESQIAMSEKIAAEKKRADFMREHWCEVSANLDREREDKEAAQAECRRLNELIESMGGK